MLMVHIKKYYEGVTQEEIPTDRYKSLEISPVHIHKDKKSHKAAILTLGDEIVSHIHEQNRIHVTDYRKDAAKAAVPAPTSSTQSTTASAEH